MSVSLWEWDLVGSTDSKDEVVSPVSRVDTPYLLVDFI